MVGPAASHFIFLLRMISRITRSPSRISIPCRRGSPPLVRCSASHSVRMRTQRKPIRSATGRCAWRRSTCAESPPRCGPCVRCNFSWMFSNKKLRYELLGLPCKPSGVSATELDAVKFNCIIDTKYPYIPDIIVSHGSLAMQIYE